MNIMRSISCEEGSLADYAFPDLLLRQGRLSATGAALKAQCLGMDDVIDDLMRSVGAWYQYPEMQERPRVIGLWGMTGTGKSSVVRAMTSAFGLSERTYWLDAGQNRDRDWLQEPMSRMGARFDGEPFVLVVDEFQHARTVNNRIEVPESSALRAFWELADSGRFPVWPCDFRIAELMDLRDQLDEALAQGVVVRKGRVVEGREQHARIFDLPTRTRRKEDERPWFVPDRSFEWLNDQYKEGALSKREMLRRFAACDGRGIVDLMDELIGGQRRMRVVDCSKALVIVLGNLDELYVMGKELMPRLDADVLAHRHRRLSIGGVQDALLRLFRIEQVGRLGTDHFLFPPLDLESSCALVKRHVHALAKRLGERSGIDMTFNDEICERLQREASVPVLGARPLIAAVNHALAALAGATLTTVQQRSWKADRIRFELDGMRLTAHVPHAGGEHQLVVAWPLAEQRQLPTSEAERIAVHEAGHLIVGMALTHMKPLQLCIGTDASRMSGFVVWDDENARPLLRQDAIGRLALGLGGYAAEQLHYGKEGVSASSSDDLRKTTCLALDLIKEEGFGTGVLFHSEHKHAPGPGFRTYLEECEAEARDWIERALVAATSVIEREHGLFKVLCGESIKHRSLNRLLIEEIVAQHGTEDLRGFRSTSNHALSFS